MKSSVKSQGAPGHAELVGGMKYGHRDLRNVLERSSARETTVRVAAGSVAKKLLKLLGIEVVGHVLEIGGIKSENGTYESIDQLRDRKRRNLPYDASMKKQERK